MKRYGLLCFFIVALFMAGTSCDVISDITGQVSSRPVATVTNIHFSTNPRATHVVFDVGVKPNGALPDTSYYVCLLSRDGYYFGSRQIVRWTKEELQGSDESERNYYKIQEAEERMIKRFTLGAPLTDKDVVALQEDCKIEAEKLAEEYARELWDDLLEGDLVELFKDAGKNPELTQSEINRIFNRHLKIVVTDKDGFIKIEYPEGETVLIDSYSGTGSFKSPDIIPKYGRLIIKLVTPTGGRVEEGLYYRDGSLKTKGSYTVKPNNEGKGWSINVEPGKVYYYNLSAPDDMAWEITIEQSNMDSWMDE